ncbi:MAG: TatD family hydrolase [Patescibacteria group bacterium]
MQIIDTHCHPQFPQYDTDREEVIQRASEQNVGMICIGTDWETSRSAIDLAFAHDNVWATVGLHPNDNLTEHYDHDAYVKLAQESKVVAIGEVGLDYYRTTEPEKKKFQRERFEKQIQLAIEINKPLVIHCRDGSASLTTGAHKDMIEMLSAIRHKLSANPGAIHSFTGTYADAKRYVHLGFKIGLNGIITFARQYDDTVMDIPLEHILLETDAPYLTPEPYRGKRNEPAYVAYVAEQVARLRKIPVEKVMQQTTENALTLFGLHETV